MIVFLRRVQNEHLEGGRVRVVAGAKSDTGSTFYSWARDRCVSHPTMATEVGMGSCNHRGLATLSRLIQWVVRFDDRVTSVDAVEPLVFL